MLPVESPGLLAAALQNLPTLSSGTEAVRFLQHLPTSSSPVCELGGMPREAGASLPGAGGGGKRWLQQLMQYSSPL